MAGVDVMNSTSDAHRATLTASAESEAAAICVEDVTKVFQLESGEKVTAVNGLCLSVAAGEFVCVLGPSGHGKSTLLNMIAGFIPPTSGEVRANGALVSGPGPDRGVVFQRDTLFLWQRVADNIGFGLRARGVPKPERDEIVNRYLRMIGLEKYGRAWPKQLSGGMRRRVAIAAVFANDPAILLMDEPFVGLDYARRATLHEVLLDLWSSSRRTVFFVTHDVDEALALADRIVVVVKGKVAAELTVSAERPRSVESLASDDMNHLRAEILGALSMGVSTA
jgi:NitT/TauT family transport system ATP-binding protein